MATTKYELKTFTDIIDAVIEEVGIQSSDTTAKNRIKRDINAVYLNEIIPYHQWTWLRKELDIQHEAAIETGTVAVTNGSDDATLSAGASPSVQDYWFNVQGDEERYRIKEHDQSEIAGETYSQDFSSSTGFTFDSTDTKFSGGTMQQVDQTPANSLFASQLTTKDLTWSKTGAITGTLNGSPTFSGGKMVCTGTQGVYWPHTTAAQESIKVKYTPNYTGGPPANINIITTYEGSNNNDRFLLFHSASGNTLRITLEDSSGSSILSASITGAAWLPTASTEYEFEVVIDSTGGSIYIFIDGTLHATNSPGAWTRGPISGRVYIGASPAVVSYNQAEGSFDDAIVFDNLQHTSGYTAGYSIVDNIYNVDTITVPQFTRSGIGTTDSLTSFTATATGSPRFTLDGQYWNGSAWAASSDTYATASSAADINTNISAFTISENNLDVKVYWDDLTGAQPTQMSVSQLTIGHSGLYQEDTTFVMDVPYTGSTNASASYKIWSDRIPLPADCDHILQVSHDSMNTPMESRSWEELYDIQGLDPLFEARPQYYSLTSYTDPDPSSPITGMPTSATRTSVGYIKTIKFASTLGATDAALVVQVGDRVIISGAGQESYNTTAIIASITTTDTTNDTIAYIGTDAVTEENVADATITVEEENTELHGERYKDLIVHPSCFDEPTTLHVRYLRKAQPLVEDADEPLIPYEDRIVLLYGVLSRAWIKQREPDEAARNLQLFRERLARMKARIESGPSKLQMQPSRVYLNKLRSINKRKGLRGYNSGI